MSVYSVIFSCYIVVICCVALESDFRGDILIGGKRKVEFLPIFQYPTPVFARDIMASGMGGGMGGVEELANMYVCKDFKDLSMCFAKLHMSVNARIDSLENKVKVLDEKTTSLEKYSEYVEASFTNLKENVVVRLDKAIETEKNSRAEAITKESKERLKLEMWGRKWNLIFRGIVGGITEPQPETERKIRAFLLGPLGFDSYSVGQMHFAAVHRLPSGYGPQKKNILVRFMSLRQRDEVMNKVYKLPAGSEVSVAPDVPAEISVIRSELLKTRKGMTAEDKKKHKLIYIKDYPFVKLVRKQDKR